MKLGEEDKIQMFILEYLETVLPKAIVFHVPNGGRRSISEGAKFKALGVMRGVPDLCMIAGDGRVYFFEVKTPKGRVSPEQHDFGMKVNAYGCRWAVVRSVEDVRLALKAWGLVTREAA